MQVIFSNSITGGHFSLQIKTSFWDLRIDFVPHLGLFCPPRWGTKFSCANILFYGGVDTKPNIYNGYSATFTCQKTVSFKIIWKCDFKKAL